MRFDLALFKSQPNRAATVIEEITRGLVVALERGPEE